MRTGRSPRSTCSSSARRCLLIGLSAEKWKAPSGQFCTLTLITPHSWTMAVATFRHGNGRFGASRSSSTFSVWPVSEFRTFSSFGSPGLSLGLRVVSDVLVAGEWLARRRDVFTLLGVVTFTILAEVGPCTGSYANSVLELLSYTNFSETEVPETVRNESE